MNPDVFANWYRCQGYHVIRSKSSYWFNAGLHVYQAFPFGWLITPSKAELSEMMMKNRIVALRYSTPINVKDGKVCYHVVLNNPYNLGMLRSQARNAVRRGLSNSNIERISFERLGTEGWNLQRDTLDRQGRISSMHEKTWRRICYSAIDLPGFEAWAAIVHGELAASLIIIRVGDMFYVPYACSHRRFLDFYVNNALFYTVSCNLLAREGVKGIFFTVQSLDAPKSVDEFKFRMGFTARAVRQKVVFNPILEPFVNRGAYKLINYFHRSFPGINSLAKADGIVRFNLQGKLPIDQQDWPDCLDKSKILTEMELSSDLSS